MPKLLKKIALTLACLLVVVGIGSVILTGKEEGREALSEKELLEEASLVADDELLSGNESVSELIEFMGMSAPPQDFLIAPSFELVSLNGERMSLEQFRGKAVLLSFWTTW